MQIGQRSVGPAHPVYVVAELGINHNGSLSLAKELVHAAAEAGADAVKLQKRNVRAVFTQRELERDYADWIGGGSTYGQYKQALELPWTSYEILIDEASRRGVDLGITFFDTASVEEYQARYCDIQEKK
ncbi:MAG TPA: N-acetylneuraminate synthase family protein, partial [Gemmatimonadales bacterium]|nr:N-acetylneuraminate synthase family protein [Gemmatimonadales bacterium]